MDAFDCSKIDWSPIASAESYSALTAVIAGFMFTGIIVLISQQGGAKDVDRRRYRTLRLFLASLLVFGFDSYLFALVAGEVPCMRAWAVATVASGLLGLGAVMMFSGLGWLLHTFVADEEGQSVMSTVMSFIVGVTAVVAVLLPVNVLGYWGDAGLVVPGWLSTIVIFGYTAATVATIIGLAIRWYRHPVAVDSVDARMANADIWLRRAVSATGGYAIFSTLVVGTLIGIEGDRWRPAPFAALPWLLGIVATVIPSAILILQVLGMPPRMSGEPSAVPATEVQ